MTATALYTVAATSVPQQWQHVLAVALHIMRCIIIQIVVATVTHNDGNI